jgi:hypothetical protein
VRGALRRFASFEAADAADDAYYASLSPHERLELLLELIARYQESVGAATERLARVHRIVELERS